MLVAHISDLHLGYSQFNLEEREEDVYEAFREAIDASIREGVGLVILAGDLFHTPRPCGKSIITLANALKKLKERQIPAVFVLGEHDISRLRDVPFAHIFSNLGLARKLRPDVPFEAGNCAVFGADKERRGNIDGLIEKLRQSGKLAEQYSNNNSNSGRKKILVLHQGLADFNKFAGELNSTDLPPGFDYYAMGHYHDHLERRFDFLGGRLAYPGSIDLTPSEGIKDVEKGFIIADLSGEEAATHWVPLLSRRRQFAARISYADISSEVDRIIITAEKSAIEGTGSGGNRKKPVARIEIAGSGIDSGVVANNLRRLNDCCLHYVWQPLEEGRDMGSGLVYDSRPQDIDAELYKLAKDALGSEEAASFAVSEILPRAAEGDAAEVLRIVWDAYKKGRFSLRTAAKEAGAETEAETKTATTTTTKATAAEAGAQNTAT